MNIALLGYGKMGRAIEKVASSLGHTVSVRLSHTPKPEELAGVDVAIEFSNPGAAAANIEACFDAGIPVVSGTTGWLENWDTIQASCAAKKGGFFYASNYSIGVNIFFDLAKKSTQALENQADYAVSIVEEHHVHKVDAPSGTAITLAEHVLTQTKQKTAWDLSETPGPEAIGIRSIREGETPGTHHLIFTSAEDTITVTHRAHGREGFAKGAVKAAAFMTGKTGVYSMNDLLKA